MPESPKERDEQWARRIRSGDHGAFERLFDAYAASLCRFALQYVDEEAKAEDVVQDVFCDLWDRRVGWRPEKSVRAYLYRAVRNTALDHLKHRRVRWAWEAEEKHASERGGTLTPMDDLQHLELEQAMRQAVEALPERRRLVYQMVRQQGMTYEEAAHVLGIKPKTVENQMGRALKALRARLSEFAAWLQ